MENDNFAFESCLNIGVFKFLVGNLALMQALSHSCWPFWDFFVEVIVFHIVCCAFFNAISLMPTQSLTSLVKYWQVLDIPCPKQVPINGVSNCNDSQENTIEGQKLMCSSSSSHFPHMSKFYLSIWIGLEMVSQSLPK